MPLRDHAKRVWKRIRSTSSRNRTPEASSTASVNDPGTSETPLALASDPVISSNEAGLPASLDPSARARNIPASNISSPPTMSSVVTPQVIITQPANDTLTPSAGTAPPVPGTHSSMSPISPQNIDNTGLMSSHNIPPAPRDSSTTATAIRDTDLVIAAPSPQSAEAPAPMIPPAPTESLPSTAHLTLPGSTAAPSSSTKVDQNAKKMAWTGLKAFGEVLKSSASTFGPLKTAVEGISGCVELFEVRVMITYLKLS
jgi:hypothetical protein